MEYGVEMVRPAYHARNALYDATVLLSPNGTTSREVVDYVKLHNQPAITESSEALIDLGLMVLAGRVAISKGTDDVKTYFGEEFAPKQFTWIDGRRYQTKKLTLAQLDRLVAPGPKKEIGVTSNGVLLKEREKMRAAGFSPEATLEDFWQAK